MQPKLCWKYSIPLSVKLSESYPLSALLGFLSLKRKQLGVDEGSVSGNQIRYWQTKHTKTHIHTPTLGGSKQ